MIAVYSLLVPVFALVILGGLAVRLRLFPVEGLPFLNRFVLNICVPVLIFSALLRVGSLAEMNWGFIAIYVGVALFLNLVAGLALRFGLGYTGPQAAMMSMGAGTANSIFLGYPIATLIFPEDAATLFAWIILGDTLLIIPITTGVAEFAASGGSGALLGRVFRPLFRNPVVIGLIMGVAYLLIGIPLPEALDGTRKALVQAAPPLALFIIGGMVASSKLTRLGPPVALLASLKLVVHPVLMFAALTLVPVLDADMTKKAVLFTAIPMFTIFTVFAERYGKGSVAASTLLITTVLGGVTVGIALMLLGFG